MLDHCLPIGDASHETEKDALRLWSTSFHEADWLLYLESADHDLRSTTAARQLRTFLQYPIIFSAGL